MEQTAATSRRRPTRSTSGGVHVGRSSGSLVSDPDGVKEGRSDARKGGRYKKVSGSSASVADTVIDEDSGTESCDDGGSSILGSDIQIPSSSMRGGPSFRRSRRISDLTKINLSEAVDKDSDEGSVVEPESKSGTDGATTSDPEDEYVVEKVITKKVFNGITHYRIKWKDWPETYNTWEPLKHLGGCPELLEQYEKRYAERKALRRDHRGIEKRIGGENPQMQRFDVHTEWPRGKKPVSVEGVVTVDDTLTYVVKCERTRGRGGSDSLDRNNAVLVESPGFRYDFPELVIQFYESRVVWSGNRPGNEEEQASVAAQIAKLNLGPRQEGANEAKQETGIPDADTEKGEEDMDDGEKLGSDVGTESKKNSAGLAESMEVINDSSDSDSDLFSLCSV